MRGEGMKSKNLSALFAATVCVWGLVISVSAQEMQKNDCLYLSSLHSTAKGMAYWYDKSNGGLEIITGVPYADIGCNRCHVGSCDACHKTEQNGKPGYSAATARNQDMCLNCHARESQMIRKIDKEANTPDVHVAAGMTCMDCHTTREMHGDGVEYQAMKAPGAMDVKCEQCHASISKSVAHTVHGDKLDCKACHVRQVVSCNSCHFETMMREKKRVSLPVSGWKFLMNYQGKVTSANMQTFVAPGDKTFMIFAPQFSHSVMKDGSKCEDCHATKIVKQVLRKKLDLSWLVAGKEQNLRGTIPVVDGVRYNCVYQNYYSGVWTPISNPVPPKLQYVGYGTPLTQEQVQNMAKPQKVK
jgi:hypothetical protein